METQRSSSSPRPAPSRALATDRREISLYDPCSAALTVQQVLGQVALIQQIMASAMKEGEHFGRIPGLGDKPTLFKPGAEKLCLTFRLAPNYEVNERELERGHREYRVTCTLSSILTGAFIGQGVGSCSSLEAKYRYRAGAPEPTDQPVPRAYWNVRQEDPAKAQELIGGKGFSVRKIDGQWLVCRGGEKVEHDNPADHFNTVLKMAKKRALVDAVLTATAASDIFTQDLEDITANLSLAQGQVERAASSEAAPTTVSVPAALVSPAAAESPATAAVADPDETVAEEGNPEQNFLGAKVHFGRNRGLTLAELSPQQLHWYEAEWMPKKESSPTTNSEDYNLVRALKAYRRWRDENKRTMTSDVVIESDPADD